METMRERLVGGRGRRMTGPDRIWIDRHGGNWSPVDGGTQDVEYIRRDPAVLAALPEVQAMVAAAYEVAAYAVTEAGRAWLGASGARAAIRALTPADATAALAARDAAMIARGMREAATLLREQGYGTAPKQILARAAEIERDGK